MPQPWSPRPSSPVVARSGNVSLFVHEPHTEEVITAWLTATSPEAFDRTRGDRDDTQPWGAYRVVGGIALIPAMGSLIPRGLFMGSGYVTSYEMLGAEIRRARADPAVDRVALMIDSPGGYVSNLDACAAEIARLREDKPCTAYVQGMACSAAYWLAASCDEIVCSPQSELGSIGVLQAHFDVSGLMEQFGVKVTLLHAGAKKVDGNPYEPLSERVATEMTARLEQLRVAFAEHVAAGRPSLDVAAVLATEAGTFIGAEAVTRGLADRVGYLADDLDDATDPLLSPSPMGRFMESMMNYTQAQYDAAVGQARTEGETKGFEKGKAEGHKDGHAAGKTDGHKDGLAEGEKKGATAERERFKAIRGCDEAKKRPVAAEGVALDTDMSLDQAKTFLARLPEEKAENASGLDAEMAKDKQPLVGADGEPLKVEGSDEHKAFAEGEAAAKKLLGKK